MEIVRGNIGQRLNELLFRLDLNQSGFAESVGVSSTAISKIINNKSKPGYDLTEAILQKYPKVNRDWFMAGQGGMFLGEEPNYFGSQSTAKAPELWQELKEQYEKRIKDLEFIVYLYKQEKGAVNFNVISRLSRVSRMAKQVAMMKVIRTNKPAHISADSRSL